MADNLDEQETQNELDNIILQERQTRALEKIGASLDALANWFEEIDKEDWNSRIQWYLSEWYENTIKPHKGED
tara:strand:+ start:6758 stop:6976 length:219 start_codon:yes stop_codon:yes gene_type:complete